MRANKRIIYLAAIAILIVCSIAVTVFAYLSTSSDLVVNSFTAAPETDPVIAETTNNPLTLKEDVRVYVGAPGYPVYVRAVILVTWEDGAGKVHAQKPVEGQDYEIVLNNTDWFKSGEYFYHRNPVDSDGYTQVLVDTCYQKQVGPDGYQLHVQIIAQTIQALGMTDGNTGVDPKPAVTDAWGIRVDGNGQLYNTVVAVAGDHWESLATKYGVDKDDLAALNGKTSSDPIAVGQIIILPKLS